MNGWFGSSVSKIRTLCHSQSGKQRSSHSASRLRLSWPRKCQRRFPGGSHRYRWRPCCRWSHYGCPGRMPGYPDLRLTSPSGSPGCPGCRPGYRTHRPGRRRYPSGWTAGRDSRQPRQQRPDRGRQAPRPARRRLDPQPPGRGHRLPRMTMGEPVSVVHKPPQPSSTKSSWRRRRSWPLVSPLPRASRSLLTVSALEPLCSEN